MNILYEKIGLTVLFCIMLSSNLFGQVKQSTPIDPASPERQRELGVVFGFGQNIQGGTLNSSCNCPSFSDGVKTGITLGVLYEFDLMSKFMFGIAGLYDNKSIESSYKQVELLPVESKLTGTTVEGKFTMRHTAILKNSYLTALPYLKWTPIDFLNFKLGISLSYLASSKIQHTKELLTNTALLSNGEVVTLNVDGYKPIEDGEMPGTSKFQIGLEPMIGFNIKLGKTTFLSPMFQYSIPLTKVSDRGEDLKISSWRILAEIRFALSLRPKY